MNLRKIKTNNEKGRLEGRLGHINRPPSFLTMALLPPLLLLLSAATAARAADVHVDDAGALHIQVPEYCVVVAPSWHGGRLHAACGRSLSMIFVGS